MFRKFLFTGFCALAVCISAARAAPLVEPNTCELIVAARQSLSEVRTYINQNISDRRFLKVFKAQNGWYAISIGSLKPHEEEPVISRWKAIGKIPSDAYCSTGKRYLAQVDPYSGTSVTTRSATTTAKREPQRRDSSCAKKTLSGWLLPAMMCGDKRGSAYYRCIEKIQEAGCNIR